MFAPLRKPARHVSGLEEVTDACRKTRMIAAVSATARSQHAIAVNNHRRTSLAIEGTRMKFSRALPTASLLALMLVGAQAAPLKATFSSEVSTTQWSLAEIDPALPPDWSEAQFLVVEVRCSTSQRFELGLTSEEGNVSKRIHPFAGVWTRASIPMRFFRNGLGDADELASTVNQPRAGYWINIEAGGHATWGASPPPTAGISSISPATAASPRT
jgi:hypothetical protein